MKRISYIYEKIVDVENCKLAIRNASKGKTKRKCVIKYLDNIDYYAEDLSHRLQELNFTSEYRLKPHKDKSSNKERTIAIPKFYPDLCAQHAINQILIYYIKRSSYYYSCANFKGRGMRRANKGNKRSMRDKYCLKTDIKHFYQSVDNDVLKELIRKKIKDKKAIEILDTLIDSIQGLPIGNYTSPQLAEWLLQHIDRVIKEKVRVKHFIRYADDKNITDNNKRRLWHAYRVLKEELAKLKLELKHNYQLFKINVKSKTERVGKGRKIDFIGNCYSSDFVTIRKWTALKIMRQSRFIGKLIKRNCAICYSQASGFISRCAALFHANAFGMRKKYMLYMKQLKEIVRGYSKKCGMKPKEIINLAY